MCAFHVRLQVSFMLELYVFYLCVFPANQTVSPNSSGRRLVRLEPDPFCRRERRPRDERGNNRQQGPGQSQSQSQGIAANNSRAHKFTYTKPRCTTTTIFLLYLTHHRASRRLHLEHTAKPLERGARNWKSVTRSDYLLRIIRTALRQCGAECTVCRSI